MKIVYGVARRALARRSNLQRIGYYLLIGESNFREIASGYRPRNPAENRRGNDIIA